MLQLPIPNVAANTTAISCTVGVHALSFLAFFHKCCPRSFKLTFEVAGCQVVPWMYENLAYDPHVIYMRSMVIVLLNYSVKNIQNDI